MKISVRERRITIEAIILPTAVHKQHSFCAYESVHATLSMLSTKSVQNHSLCCALVFEQKKNKGAPPFLGEVSEEVTSKDRKNDSSTRALERSNVRSRFVQIPGSYPWTARRRSWYPRAVVIGQGVLAIETLILHDSEHVVVNCFA